MLMTDALLADAFDSRAQLERTLLTAMSPSWIFDLRRLESYDMGATSGHGDRSSSFAPTLRLAEAAAAVAERKVRRPGRGRARLEPPTRLDAAQTADAGRSAGAAQLDLLLSIAWDATGGNAGAKTCGAGGADTAGHTGSTDGTVKAARSINGAETCMGCCTSARLMLAGCAGAVDGDAARSWPSMLSEKQVERGLLMLLARFDVFA